MKKSQKIIIILTLIATFLLVYKPHFDYPMPYHIDEWHHISEGIRMGNYGEYFEILRDQASNKYSGLEMGFHLFLFILSAIFNLVSIYQFLPGLWAVLSAFVLFYVIYKKTNKNFLLAWLSVVFFASIKSNVNIGGLWFMTPLTFAIPFIFLYTYLITEGIEKQNKKYFLWGLAVMILLIPTHSISVLFIIPALIIYILINYRYAIKEYLLFSSLALIPVIGLIFFKYVFDVSWNSLPARMINNLTFEYGWGVLELKNSPTELYSIVGWVLAIFGIYTIYKSNKLKKYTLYVAWPLTMVFMIFIYRLTGVSVLSPYQRNLYYLAISLPFLSAIGAYEIIKLGKEKFSQIIENEKSKQFLILNVKINIGEQYKSMLPQLFSGIIVLVIMLFTFMNYYNIPNDLSLYKPIQEKHYKALKYLSQYKPATAIATPFVSVGLYPIAGQKPVGTVLFYGNKQVV